MVGWFKFQVYQTTIRSSQNIALFSLGTQYFLIPYKPKALMSTIKYHLQIYYYYIIY